MAAVNGFRLNGATYAALLPLAEQRVQMLYQEIEQLQQFMKTGTAGPGMVVHAVAAQPQPQRRTAARKAGNKTPAKRSRMSDAARKAVGVRMKKYWKARRAAEARA